MTNSLSHLISSSSTANILRFQIAKKEVNSVTKLCRNHRLKQIESDKGYKLMRDNECILRVAIMASNKSSERFNKS